MLSRTHIRIPSVAGVPDCFLYLSVNFRGKRRQVVLQDEAMLQNFVFERQMNEFHAYARRHLQNKNFATLYSTRTQQGIKKRDTIFGLGAPCVLVSPIPKKYSNLKHAKSTRLFSNRAVSCFCEIALLHCTWQIERGCELRRRNQGTVFSLHMHRVELSKKQQKNALTVKKDQNKATRNEKSGLPNSKETQGNFYLWNVLCFLFCSSRFKNVLKKIDLRTRYMC